MRLHQGPQVQVPLDYRRGTCREREAQAGFRLLQLRAVSVVQAEVMAEVAVVVVLAIALMLKSVELVALAVLAL
jgi:hypothetical protein